MNKKEAYKIVLADLKKYDECDFEDYALGCYSCDVGFVYKGLKSLYDISIKRDAQ